MKAFYRALILSIFALSLLGCVSKVTTSSSYKTIIFRARIFEAAQVKNREILVKLHIMHVGADPGSLLPGKIIKIRFGSTNYLDLYGWPWRRQPEESVGFADNYMIDQHSDGTFSNLRFAPQGSPDVVVRGTDFWDSAHEVISVTQ